MGQTKAETGNAGQRQEEIAVGSSTSAGPAEQSEPSLSARPIHISCSRMAAYTASIAD